MLGGVLRMPRSDAKTKDKLMTASIIDGKIIAADLREPRGG